MPPEHPIAVPDDAFERAAALQRRLDAVAPSKFTVGVGLKQIGTQFTDQIALFVYVAQKRPLGEVPEAERIPPEFEGYPTDVVEHRPTLAADVARYDPMRGGIQISRSGGTGVIGIVHYGTLGAVVRRRADGRLLLLTCAHVVGALNADIFQPAHGETGAAIVGSAVAFRDEGSPLLLDCAVIQNTSRGLQKTVEEIGPVKGVETTVPAMWSAVKKRGARTLLTTGRVTRLVPGAVPAVSAIEVASQVPGQVFAGRGDSGSALLDEQDRIIGLLFAIPNEDVGTGMSSGGLAMPIHTVQEALQVDVAVAPTVMSVAPNTALAAVANLGRVAIEGWGFDSSSQVAFDQMPAIVLTATPTRLDVVMPAHFPGAVVDVIVRNAIGEASAAHPGSKFTY